MLGLKNFCKLVLGFLIKMCKLFSGRYRRRIREVRHRIREIRHQIREVRHQTREIRPPILKIRHLIDVKTTSNTRKTDPVCLFNNKKSKNRRVFAFFT